MNKQLTIWLPAIRSGSGADVFTLRLAQALERAGHKPVLQWFAHKYELMPWRLARVRPPAGIDIVHAGSWQGFAFKRPNIPLVITEHQYITHPAFVPFRGLVQTVSHRLLAESWMRKSYDCADEIVAVSNFCAEAMRRDLGRNITVIHTWVDTTLFAPRCSPADKVEFDDPEGRGFRLLFVGNPSHWKGSDLLPEIAKRLGEHFLIYCMGGLRQHIYAHQLPKNMFVLPRRDPKDMPAIYNLVDAVLIPARYDAFGYVAL